MGTVPAGMERIPARGAAAVSAAALTAPPAAASSAIVAPPQSLVTMVSAAVRETYANGGLRGFYRGIGFTLLRAAPVAGVVLPVYDTGMAWFAARERAR